MLCVDASLIIRILTSNEPESVYERLWNQWQQSNTIIVAPTLIMYEVSNGLYRYSRAGEITPDEAEQLLERALHLGIQFIGDAELHRQAFKIAQRYNLPATYDAHYLALAARLTINFWTSERRSFNAVGSSLPFINLAA